MKRLIFVILFFTLVVTAILIYNAFFVSKDILIKNIYPEIDSTSKLEVIDGTTSDRFSISNKEDIKVILDIISNTPLKKSSNQKLKAGYMYDISFLKNDVKKFSIVLSGNEVIIQNKVYMIKSSITKDIENTLKKYH